MRKFVRGLLLPSLLVLASPVFSQKPSVKFGDIQPSDFAPTAYAVDSSASGVVLYDVGSSKYEGNTSGGFSIAFKRHTRIRLLNRNSFDLATISIPLYASGAAEERIESLEANTYNLENGKVETFKLDKGSIFKDRLNKNYTVRKFTLPNIKEGSIIEIKYSFVSPYPGDLRSWYFQGEYPVVWSEYKVSIPTIYDFVTLTQGYTPYKVNEGSMGIENYNILDGDIAGRSELYSFRSDIVNHTWAMENVPALKKESFTTTLDNHISKISFQLSRVKYPNSPAKNIMNSWNVVSEELLKDEDFGANLAQNGSYWSDEVKKITAGATTPLESAKKIFEYVRDNMSCTNYSAKYLSNPLKKVYQTKNGNVADINLLLTTLLKNKGLDARPALLSTRDHGKAMELYPILEKLNYVISRVVIDDKSYLLDASQNKLGFGHLDLDCYNGFARIIDKDFPELINLSADSIRENKLTSVFIINDGKGGLKGSFVSHLGDYESTGLREKFVKTTQEDYFKEIKKGFSFDVDLSNQKVDSLKMYEDPVTVSYDMQFKPEDEMIYLNPVFGEAWKENPFKSAERLYPVEMPYGLNETFLLNMEIPKGYTIEELPKSSRVKFNEDEGMFEYMVVKDANSIQLRSSVKLNKATFSPDDYQNLRDFFGYIVKKHSEQIVLKKIKA
ncbi:transglutaminase domain-containing protein [Segetibacter aerophilus]|uniref:DUF3857 domain-containing protein n=1 Tax=Segetibacter aerophilus TaxID=670293 RepID=A0A512BJR4_9BACT|nr:transglutaminase domain-containing protein [Segetibacter aerophilus]GEO12198.1 hypothetical protein SAE01_46940 [Segetibacter aerophilus]